MNVHRPAGLAILVIPILLGAGRPSAAGLFGRSRQPLPFSPEEKTLFYSVARDPRQFNITVYESSAGAVYTGGDRVHLDRLQTLPFLTPRRSALSVIKVKGRKPGHFRALLDTSSPQSWMDARTALALEAIPLSPPMGEQNPVHVQDTARGYLCWVDVLCFDQFLVDSVLVSMQAVHGPLGPLARGIVRGPPQLVLGYDFLKALRYLQLDYPHHRAVLSASDAYVPDPTTLMARLPCQEIRGALAVNGMVDDRATPVILDTAGDFELALPAPAGDHIQHFSLGNLVFRNVACADSDQLGLGLTEYPRAGRHLLSRYKITLDNDLKVVYFERPGDLVRKATY